MKNLAIFLGKRRRLDCSFQFRLKSTLKTFDNQSNLPRLPVPSLQETAAKYLDSLRPLLDEKEFKHSEKVVSDFIKEGGVGEKLQKRLLEYEKTQKVESKSLQSSDLTFGWIEFLA
jgi:hypothetical protein